MKLVILITAKPKLGLEVAQAWQEVGSPGATIIRSHGLHTLRSAVQEGNIEVPRMRFSSASMMAQIIRSVEETSMVILTVVHKEIIEKIIEATTEILGDLTSPHTGVIFVLDVEQAVGVRDHSKDNNTQTD